MSATQLALPRTRRSIRAVAEALFSGAAGPPPAERLDWAVAEVLDLLRHAGARSRLLFQLCLLLVSWLAPLWIFRLPPLRRLSTADRIRALGRLEDSPACASLVLACKAVLCMVYYEEEAAARAIAAYEPCHPDRRRLPLLTPQVAVNGPQSARLPLLTPQAAANGPESAGLPLLTPQAAADGPQSAGLPLLTPRVTADGPAAAGLDAGGAR